MQSKESLRKVLVVGQTLIIDYFQGPFTKTDNKWSKQKMSRKLSNSKNKIPPESVIFINCNIYTVDNDDDPQWHK